MRLHQAGIRDATVRRGTAHIDTSVRLLQHDRQDIPVINERGIGAVLDGVEEVGIVFCGVVGRIAQPAARFLNVGEIVIPHLAERDPFRRIWERCWSTLVIGVDVLTGADAVLSVVDAVVCTTTFLESDGVVDLGVRRRVFERRLLRPNDGTDDYDDECNDPNDDADPDLLPSCPPALFWTSLKIVIASEKFGIDPSRTVVEVIRLFVEVEGQCVSFDSRLT